MRVNLHYNLRNGRSINKPRIYPENNATRPVLFSVQPIIDNNKRYLCGVAVIRETKSVHRPPSIKLKEPELYFTLKI
jgi:hypothetical protein